MRDITKLEEMLGKKKEKASALEAALKKTNKSIKDIEKEIEAARGESFRADINALKLTQEEYARFKETILSDRKNLFEVLDMLAEEKRIEGEKPLYE